MSGNLGSGFLYGFKLPLSSWSCSINSNNVLKLPAPNPSLSHLWIISKNKVGRSTIDCVNICNKYPPFSSKSINIPN